MLNLGQWFLCSKDGAFAILTALTLPILLVVAGLAIDTTRVLNARTHAQNAADAAALATVGRLLDGSLTEDGAEQFAIRFYNGQIDGGSNAAIFAAGSEPTARAKLNVDHGTRAARVEVKAQGAVHTTFPIEILPDRLFRYQVMAVAQNQAETHSPLSMVLVLDDSGSMGCDLYAQTSIVQYLRCLMGQIVTRVSSLKSAVEALADALTAADPEAEFIRLGAVTYYSEIRQEEPLRWGVGAGLDLLPQLAAKGGTNAAPAIDRATEWLTQHSESAAHTARGNGDPTRIMVLMTDGEMDPAHLDAAARSACDRAKANEVEIFTIAFEAPKRGKKLLRDCASSQEHVFEPSGTSELVATFEEIGARATEGVLRLTH